MARRETPSQQATRLLKAQWAATMADVLRDVAAGLPESHPDRPGLIRAAEVIRYEEENRPR